MGVSVIEKAYCRLLRSDKHASLLHQQHEIYSCCRSKTSRLPLHALGMTVSWLLRDAMSHTADSPSRDRLWILTRPRGASCGCDVAQTTLYTSRIRLRLPRREKRVLAAPMLLYHDIGCKRHISDACSTAKTMILQISLLHHDIE